MGVKKFGGIKERSRRRQRKKETKNNRCEECGLPKNSHDHSGCWEIIRQRILKKGNGRHNGRH